MDYINSIIYFGITIAILVFVHEFGHFAAAKLSKMRVDIFAIGFGKRLLGWNKLNGFSFGDLPKDFDGQGNTDYRICLLPLGGYVKIAGMVDESFDTKFANQEPQPYEFRAKPTYKKLFVISAGVFMNLLLTVIVFWGMNFFQGKQVINTTTVGVVKEESVAEKAGFVTNDKILSIDGTVVSNWEEVLNVLLIENLGQNAEVKVLREGGEVIFKVPGKLIAETSQNEIFLNYGLVKPFIRGIIEDSPASEAGIEPGDILLELNSVPLNTRDDAIKVISSNIENTMPLIILRGEDTIYTSVTPGMDGKIGVELIDYYLGPSEYQAYGFFDSFVQSITNIGQYTGLTFVMLKNVIVGDIKFNQAFGGPVKIAKFAAKSADSGMVSFLYFLAMLSLSLAIINILPFPVLDGGHIVIICIEGVIRKELPIKVKIVIQNTGFALLLLLMAFVIYNDIISL